MKINFFDRVSVRLPFFILAAILLLTIVITMTSYNGIIAVYQDYYNNKTTLTNRLAAVEIEAEEIIPYINALKTSETIERKQLEYYNDRQKMLGSMKNQTAKNDLPVRNALYKNLMSTRNMFEKYKDEQYERLVSQLIEFKNVASAKHLYIIADTGVADMYTYIFDAHEGDITIDTIMNIDDFGVVAKKSMFGEAERVFESGAPMTDAEFYLDEVNGSVYYALSPIIDDYGNVVALIGTDIDVSELNDKLADMLLVSFSAMFIIATVIMIVLYIYLKNGVTDPIQSLTDISEGIADGNLYIKMPSKLLLRKDEVGALANSIYTMTNSYQNLITGTSCLFESVKTGRIDMRNDPANYKNDFSTVVSQINETMDVMRMYFDSISESLLILTPELDFAFSNKMYNLLFSDLTQKQIVSTLLETDGTQDLSELAEMLAETLSKSHSGSLQKNIWYELPDEKMACFSVVCCGLKINDINNGMIILASDITDLMREKEKAQEASKAKTEFLSRVSHELRTPMNVIIGMSNLGLKDADEDGAERFQQILSASNHLLSIINDVLDMSRIESGKTTLTNAPFDLRELVTRSYNLLQVQAEDKNLVYTLDIEDGIMPDVYGDASHFGQVLINLLTNAIKFTEPEGFVKLEAKLLSIDIDKTQNIRFTISDNGIGMSKEFLERAFFPFEQEGTYLKRTYKGTGLGLSISKNLVDLMNGTISIQSELGQGSVFILDIPFVHSTSETISALSDTAKDNENAVNEALKDMMDFSGLKIILADDIDINRMIICEVLSETGIEIIETDDGQATLEAFNNSAIGEIDLIFMDIQMPIMDGYHSTTLIRDLDRPDAKTVPIIAMTANALQQDVEQVMARGMNMHLSKPVDFDECLNAVRYYCEKKLLEKMM